MPGALRWTVILLLVFNFGIFLQNVDGLPKVVEDQEIRKEDLAAIDELKSENFNELNLKEIETLLFNADNDVHDDKDSKVNEISKIEGQKVFVEQAKTAQKHDRTINKQTKVMEKDGDNSFKHFGVENKQKHTGVKDKSSVKTVKNESKYKNTNKESTKKILDAIMHRIRSNHYRDALGKGRTTPSSEAEKAGNNKTALPTSETINVRKTTKNFSKVTSKTANNAATSIVPPRNKDSIVFSRLETIAHRILRVLRQRENSRQGSKLRYKINRDDLLKIRDFIKKTRNPKIERKTKVRSAKEALIAIKDLLKIIKRNRFGQVERRKGKYKIGNALASTKKIPSHAYTKSKVPKENKKPAEKDTKVLSKTNEKVHSFVKDKETPNQNQTRKFNLEKLEALRISLLKAKLLKVLKMRERASLNTGLKRLISKLEKQVNREKRTKRHVEQENEDEKHANSDEGEEKEYSNQEKVKRENEKKMVKKKQDRSNKDDKSTKKSRIVGKELRNIVHKKLQKLNIIARKEERAMQQGTKRFSLAHGPKTFRKNLISLAEMDANKMTDEDLKTLHDKINEWLEVEEKLERETENGEVKNEISSGIDQANDLLSLLQFQDGKNYENRVENDDNKKNRRLEWTIDVNKQGKAPSVSTDQGNRGNVEETINTAIENGDKPVNNMSSSSHERNVVTRLTNNQDNNFVAPNGYRQASEMHNNNNQYSNDINGPLASEDSPPTNPSDNKYLKEIAMAYMNGKEIIQNKNFADNLKKFEENFDNNVNTIENGNHNVNNNENLNDLNPSIQNIDNKNGNGLNPSNSNTGNGELSENGNGQKRKQTFSETYIPRSSNAYNVNSASKLNNEQDFNYNKQPSQHTNSNLVEYNNKISGNYPRKDTDDETKDGDLVNKGGNRLNSNVGKTFGINLNGVPKENAGRAVNGGMITNEGQIMNDGKVSNTRQGNTEGQERNGGQIIEGGEITKEGRGNNVGVLPTGHMTVNSEIVDNKEMSTDGETVKNVDLDNNRHHNGHIVTNEGQNMNEFGDISTTNVENQQTPDENTNPATDYQTGQVNEKHAANQLANTMKQEDSNAVSNIANNQGTSDSKNSHPGAMYREMKPTVVNPYYDDQTYNAEAYEGKTDDEENVAKQEQLRKNKTPFLQSDKAKNLVGYQNPTSYNSPNKVQPNSQNGNLNKFPKSTSQTIEDGSPGAFYRPTYHDGKTMILQRGQQHTQYANNRMVNRLKNTRQMQRLALHQNEKIFHNMGGGNKKDGSTRITKKPGKYQQNLARMDNKPLNSVQTFYPHSTAPQETPTLNSTFEHDEDDETDSNEQNDEKMQDSSRSMFNKEEMTDDSINTPTNKFSKEMHGKALLNNFLAEEDGKGSHSLKVAHFTPQSSYESPQATLNVPMETNEKYLSENFSGNENLNQEAPQASAKLTDDFNDDQTQSTTEMEPNIKNEHSTQNFGHQHNLTQRNKGNISLQKFGKPKHSHKHALHHKNLTYGLNSTKQRKKVHKIEEFAMPSLNKKVAQKKKAVVNVKKVPNAYAFIQGAIKGIPTPIIHLAQAKPNSVAPKSGQKPNPHYNGTHTNDAKVLSDSNETTAYDGLNFVMPKLKKVNTNVTTFKASTSPDKAKYIEEPSTDQETSISAVSSNEMGAGGGGMESSGISSQSSKAVAQSFADENKISYLNENGVLAPNDATETTLSSDVGKMALSSDPTDSTEYEHKIDLAERTEAGDIVPVGLGEDNPNASPVSNTPDSKGTGASPEHVLLSPDSAKGDDLLKPLGQDPDGKMAAMQDLKVLTKAEKEQENSVSQDSEKISDPAFLEGMSNRISVSGSPLDSMGMTHTPNVPLRDIDQPDSTLVVPNEKLKRDNSDESAFQHGNNAQFAVNSKVVALGSQEGKLKIDSNLKSGQLNTVPRVHQIAESTLESRLAAPALQTRKPSNEAGERGGKNTPSSSQHDGSYNLAPRIKALVKEIIKESLGNNALSKGRTRNRATEELFDGDRELLLNSEKKETKPFPASFTENLKNNIKDSGASHRPQSHGTADNSKETLYLPNDPSNSEGDRVFFGGESQPTNTAGTMDILSKSNLSEGEKKKLIRDYQDSQKTATSTDTEVRNNPSKARPSPAITEPDAAKLNKQLQTGKFTEHDLKSDFAGKEAAMQDMIMLEKERDMDDKLSEAHLLASQLSKQKQLGNGSPRQQENAMTSASPGNLSPDVTLAGNMSPGAQLLGTLPTGITSPGNNLSPNIALPSNSVPGAGSQEQMFGYAGQQNLGLPKDDASMATLFGNSPIQNKVPNSEAQGQMARVVDANRAAANEASMMAHDIQMDKLLDQAQGATSHNLKGENTAANYGMAKSRKALASEALRNGLNYELKSIDNTIAPNQTLYDSVETGNGIGKFVDSVQGLSPAEVRAYGIDSNNDVYIDKPARQRTSEQRSSQEGYTTMGPENERDMESFGGSIRKSHVNKTKKRVKNNKKSS